MAGVTAAQSENLGDAAERLLSRVRETHYQHRTYADQSRGAYDMDCSGFVDYLLEHFAPVQFAPLRVEPGHTRPRAAMYFDLFRTVDRKERTASEKGLLHSESMPAVNRSAFGSTRARITTESRLPSAVW